MCGVSGEHRKDGSRIDPHVLTSMAGSMFHRGPDSEGYLSMPGIGFASRRLAIIDVDGGDQPIFGCTRELVVQANAEIYNFKDLRNELQALGHRFRTQSDVEVIVHGYEEWGLEVAQHLNGIFAFAIWDDVKQQLVLARDHLGVKPLYYFEDGRRLRFGSEMRAILADSSVPRELDYEALRLFLHFGYVPAPNTLVRSIRKLRPGHLLTSDRTGVKSLRYWNPQPVIDDKISVNEAAEQYQTLFTDAVHRQLTADVPVGVLLSGGVDSAMILAAANAVGAGGLHTFTVGFEGEFDHDETAHASHTASLFGSEHHHEIKLNEADFSGIFQKSLWHLEEPVLSQSTFAFQLLTQKVREHVKVVLTGQGADEPWAGYDRYLGERYGARARWIFRSTSVRNASERLPGNARLRRATESLGETDPVRRFAAIHQVFSPDQVARAARGGLVTEPIRAEDAIRYWQEPVKYLDPFSQLLYVDTRMSLADDLLLYGDKLSMANSVEARVPFLDLRIMEFVEQLPPNFKLRGRTTKYVHKRAAKAMLPSEIVHRPKKGFATPVESWFAGDFAPTLERLVLGPDSMCREVLDDSLMIGLLNEHVRGKKNNRRELTALLSLEVVMRQLFTGSDVPSSVGSGVLR
jgi:asparagine synthase (glutamine-hydrolysing)